MGREGRLQNLSLSEKWINNEVKSCMVGLKVCSAIIKQFVFENTTSTIAAGAAYYDAE